jgi:hypothetical protein
VEVVRWIYIEWFTGAISMAVMCISLVDGHPGTKRLETFKS